MSNNDKKRDDDKWVDDKSMITTVTQTGNDKWHASQTG